MMYFSRSDFDLQLRPPQKKQARKKERKKEKKENYKKMKQNEEAKRQT